MSTIKSSAENLTLNADGANNDIKFQSNGSEVASIDQAGLLTATTFAGSGASLTNLPVQKPSITDGGNATAMTIDSSEHVLIGKTSTSSSVAGVRFAGDAAGYSEHTRDGGAPLYLNRLTSDGTIITFAKANTAVGSIDVSASGASINLGGTAAANTLDDYEEGTWTPSGTNVRSSSVGHYRKIGNMCLLQGWVYVEAAGSTNNYIEGLPFTAADTGNANGGGTPIWVQSDITGLYVVGSTTRFNLYGGSNRSTSTPLSASHQMHFVLQYITT